MYEINERMNTFATKAIAVADNDDDDDDDV